MVLITPIENLGSPIVEENDDPHDLFFHERCSKEGDQVDLVEGCKDIKEPSKNPPLEIVNLVEGIIDDSISSCANKESIGLKKLTEEKDQGDNTVGMKIQSC